MKIVCQCLFKRTRKSKTERGIAIGSDGGVAIILDCKDKPVKAVWTYTLLPYEGCLIVPTQELT